MNLFGGRSKQAETTTPPSIDEARKKSEGLKKQAGMRGRAAALLVSGSPTSSDVAKREVTGN